MRRALFVTALGLAVGMVGRTEAGILVKHDPGGSGEITFYGQSVTTPTGGPFHDISFLIFPRSTDPPFFVISGSLFLLTQEYLGAPSDLSSATPGYLASTSTFSGREWFFDSSVTLDGGTQYFLYTNALIDFKITSTEYGGGTAYQAFAPDGDFLRQDFDTNFQLSGTPVAAVPEPSTLLLAGLGGLGLAGTARRRRRTRVTERRTDGAMPSRAKPGSRPDPRPRAVIPVV